MILHAGLLALLHREAWCGVLIAGPSGAGKSDLALRMMEAGFALVADDRTLVWTSGGRLFGRSPDVLAGHIEARGYGVLHTERRDHAQVRLVVNVDPAGPIERLPDQQTRDVLGLAVPLVRQLAFEASAPMKIRRWLMALG